MQGSIWGQVYLLSESWPLKLSGKHLVKLALQSTVFWACIVKEEQVRRAGVDIEWEA